MAMSVAAEQALGRIVRKAEQLHGYLEGGQIFSMLAMSKKTCRNRFKSNMLLLFLRRNH